MTTAPPPASPLPGRRGRAQPAGGPVDRVPDRATVDLLGVLAYGELSAFDRLAEDARLAPTLGGRADPVRDGGGGDRPLRAAATTDLRAMGVTIEEAMGPFVAALDTSTPRPRPRSWLEALVKAYVGDWMAADFYREVATWVSGDTGALV